MALALESRHDGTIRFYREAMKYGGGMVAVFPHDAGGRVGSFRDALTSNGHGAVHVTYIRNRCRPANETDGHDMRAAERMLEHIDQRAEYVRELESASNRS